MIIFLSVEQPKTVINIEEPIGKTVGRRLPPTDPFAPENSSIERAIAWQKALPVTMPPRGVFRFKSHDEADEWWIQNTRPKKSR